jgi:hypothetical protein
MIDGTYIIYEAHHASTSSYLAKILSKLAIASATLGIGLFVFSYLPRTWFSKDSVVKSNIVSETANIDQWQPVFDPILPQDPKLIIPAIGVETNIGEGMADSLETVLRQGPWRIFNFGTPAQRQYPTIIAAHRYGYLAWSNTFRRKNSFFNLPKLKAGDIIEIDWQQRKYVYGVYAEGKGKEIADYSADLILYTCETLDSPVRIFKYAKLLKV